jgi:hypothetical protein
MRKFLLLTAIVAYAAVPTSSAVDASAEEYAVMSTKQWQARMKSRFTHTHAPTSNR